MTDFSEQIQRIKLKLSKARKVDCNFEVFGAKEHKYELNKPATTEEIEEFETEYLIELPNCYKEFLLGIGNGGNGFANSGAGPFYGIYPLGKNIDDLIYYNTKKYLKLETVLYPKMTDEFWKKINSKIEQDENISDDDYEIEIGNIYKGILPIGSQGCTYIHGIIIKGKHKGKVINLDLDRQKPQFTFEDNFLDWYERWLNEIISKDLLQEKVSWFGYNIGGTPQELISRFSSSQSLSEKTDYLNGLLNKKIIDTNTLIQIEKECKKNDGDIKNKLLGILCIHNYEKSKKYLSELSENDFLTFLKYIYWYAKEKCVEWFQVLIDNREKINDEEETFRFYTYVLIETKKEIKDIIIPFTNNPNEKIRQQAYYTLGGLKNKKDLVSVQK